MDFEDIIMNLELDDSDSTYIMKIGTVPVMLTAVHTMQQYKENGEYKYSEPFTKAIARYVSTKVGGSYFIKLEDTGLDSNRFNDDDFKRILVDLIKEHDIKLLIDLHGARFDREFDVEFGTMNNLSIDKTTVRTLEDSFVNNGIINIAYNEPFKGGAITQTVYDKTNIDIVQIEINEKYRDIKNSSNIEKICNSLIDFIKKYSNFH